MFRFVVVLCSLALIASANPLGGKIVGGADAQNGQFPYQISILYDGLHSCGGTIINNRWIVTAAHCLEGLSASRMAIAVGTVIREDPNARSYPVDRAIMHEGWDSYDLVNDIGVIRVSEDIEFNDNVQPIPLDTENVGAGVSLTLSGWGSTSYPGAMPTILQWIQLRSVSQEVCQDYHWSITIRSTHLCTLTRRGEGSCHGDSGGPLVREGRLAGVVSFAVPCAVGEPDVFTRVSQYVSWINQNIA